MAQGKLHNQFPPLGKHLQQRKQAVMPVNQKTAEIAKRDLAAK